MKRVILILLLAFMQISYSQWEQCNGPYGGTVNTLVISGSNIFAGTWGSSVFRTKIKF